MISPERFLRAFCRPFQGDGALEQAAREQFEPRLREADAAEVDGLAERLEKRAHRRTGGWLKLLTLAGVAAGVAMLVKEGYTLSRGPMLEVRGIYGSGGARMPVEWLAWVTARPGLEMGRKYYGEPGSHDPDTLSMALAGLLRARLLEGVPADQQELVAGPWNQNDSGRAARALWEAHPEDPALYAAYARKALMWNQPLPENFVETGARLDPGNAWFPLTAAAVKLEKAVDRTSSRKSAVVDAARFDEAMALVHQAAGMSRCDSYRGEIQARRMKLLVRPVDSLSLVSRSLLDRDLFESTLFSLERGFQAAAEKPVAAGDADGLATLATDWKAVCRLRASSALTSYDIIQSTRLLKTGGELLTGARSIGATTAIGIMEPVMRAVATIPGPTLRASRQWIGYHSSGYAAEMTGLTTLEEGDYEPQRRMAHAIHDRAVLWHGDLAWLIAAGILAGGILFRPKPLRRMAARFPMMLDAADWSWIAGLGLVLPAAIYFTVLLTPLGCRDYGATWCSGITFFTQLGCTLLLPLLLVLDTAAWRLARRTAPLTGHGGHGIYMQALLAGMLVLLLAGSGVTRYWPAAWVGKGTIACVILLVVMMISVIVRACLLAYGTESTRLFRMGVIHTAMPVLALGFIAMAAAVPLLEKEERDWTARDTIFANSPDPLGLSRSEYEGTMEAKQHLQQALLEE